MTGARLELRVAGSHEPLELVVRTLVVAGFTGRDRELVERHVEELAREGVPRPARVPDFYRLPASLLTTGDAIEVGTRESSGEGEPVLLCARDGWYVGVGSDHTARDVERRDIAASKRACPKVLGREVVPVGELAGSLDELMLRSWAGGRTAPYQEASLSALLPLEQLVARLRVELGGELPDGLAVFLGTVPLTNGLLVSDRYAVEIASVDGALSIGCHYRVRVCEERA